MTVHFSYKITPRARISAGRAAEVQQARRIHHVLPGTTIRGALGAAWWHDPVAAFKPTAPEAERQEAFDRLFEQLVVREAKPNVGLRLRALSQLTVKYPGAGTNVRGQHDLAAGALAECPACGAGFGAPRGWTSVDGATAMLDRCASCGSVFDMERGGWLFEGPTATVTRTALEPSGVAKKSALFTRPAVEKNVVYEGRIQVRDADAVPEDALQWLTSTMSLSIGGQRSTLGRAGWSVSEADAPTVPRSDLVVMQLHSPAILVDGRGLPTLDLTGYLQSLEGGGGLACRPWTRPAQVSTWHAMAGIPKPVEWALEVGTTAVLAGWSTDALARLADGIGVRQREGFGHVVLVAPGDLPRFSEAEATEASHETVQVDHVAPYIELTRGRGQSRAVNGLLKAARSVDSQRRLGAATEDLARLIDNTLAYPWVRALGPDAQTKVAELLASAELPAIITQLAAWRTRA